MSRDEAARADAARALEEHLSDPAVFAAMDAEAAAELDEVNAAIARLQDDGDLG